MKFLRSLVAPVNLEFDCKLQKSRGNPIHTIYVFGFYECFNTLGTFGIFFETFLFPFNKILQLNNKKWSLVEIV